MLTLFDVFAFVVCVGGACLGGSTGHARGGVIGAIAGAAIGGYAGLVVGRLPGALAVRWVLRSLRRTSTEALLAQVEREHVVAHLIFAELATRGVPVDVFRPIIERQLASASPDERRFGEANARLWLGDHGTTPPS